MWQDTSCARQVGRIPWTWKLHRKAVAECREEMRVQALILPLWERKLEYQAILAVADGGIWVPAKFHQIESHAHECWGETSLIHPPFPRPTGYRPWNPRLVLAHTSGGRFLRAPNCWWFRNPAPVDMANIPWFTGFYPSQVVQDSSINSMRSLQNLRSCKQSTSDHPNVGLHQTSQNDGGLKDLANHFLMNHKFWPYLIRKMFTLRIL